MKKRIFSLLLLSCVLQCVIAQPDSLKTYLVTEGKEWAVERYTMGGVQGVYSYCLQGDTIINGKEYKIRGTKKDQMEYLEKEITVYYNSEMPSDSSTTLTIYTDTADMFTTVFSIVSIVIFIVAISLILLIVRIFKKISQENSRIDNNDNNNNKPIKL